LLHAQQVAGDARHLREPAPGGPGRPLTERVRRVGARPRASGTLRRLEASVRRWPMPQRELEEHVRALLRAIDPEAEREGLARTPGRVARALTFLTKGYQEDPRQVINGALFTENYSEMIVLKDIDFFSLCDHHILPF